MTLALRQLRVHAGTRRLLGPLDLELAPGRCLGVVGESGSGKSLTALALLGLLPDGLHASGEVLRDAVVIPLGACIAPEHAALRGRVLGWVPQDPLASVMVQLYVPAGRSLAVAVFCTGVVFHA